MNSTICFLFFVFHTIRAKCDGQSDTPPQTDRGEVLSNFVKRKKEKGKRKKKRKTLRMNMPLMHTHLKKDPDTPRSKMQSRRRMLTNLCQKRKKEKS